MPVASRPAHTRPGRLPLARLLSLLSLCLLIFLIGWQVWLRLGQPADQSAGQLPADERDTNAQAAKPDEAGENNAFIERDNSTDQIAAAATLLCLGVQGSTAAPAELAIMKAGHEAHLWVLTDIESAMPLRTRFLRGITDSQPVASGLKGTRADDMEFAAYIEALNKAAMTPAYAFANSARTDATYAHLMSDPNDYRGDVIHIEGRLKRVRRFNPPIASDRAVVRDFYEAYIFVRERGADPACLVFTELPEGLQVADKMEVKVAFNGYFFKRYRFKAADSGPNQAREAPLLIGRTLVLLEKPIAAAPADSGTGASSLLAAFMTLILLTIALAVGFTWWFRRSDRHVRSRLAGAMLRDFEEPVTDQTPLPQQALPPTRFTLDSDDPTHD